MSLTPATFPCYHTFINNSKKDKRQPKDRAILALVFSLIALIIAVLDMFILRFE